MTDFSDVDHKIWMAITIQRNRLDLFPKIREDEDDTLQTCTQVPLEYELSEAMEECTNDQIGQ
jgi:hypothetical protein